MFNVSGDIKSLKHGGNLAVAIQQYGVPAQEWLDMSTGVSPWGYPVPTISESAWQDLPPNPDALIEAAGDYYTVVKDNIVVTPGSQIGIRLLPQLLEPAAVAVPQIGYQEHAYSWALAGHRLCYYKNTNELAELVSSRRVEHAVLINPNNPSCEYTKLSLIEKIVSEISGTVIVDEAFIDSFVDESQSEVSAVGIQSNKLIVLRSIGKFFGLAGARVGFAIGCHPLLKRLRILLEPWSISHASMLVTQHALLDSTWQESQRLRIKERSKEFESVLNALTQGIDGIEIKNALLFHTAFADIESLQNVHEALAKKGVWTRLFNEGDDPAWLRFSLPASIQMFEERVSQL